MTRSRAALCLRHAVLAAGLALAALPAAAPGPASAQARPDEPQGRDLIRAIQQRLAALGFDPGPADGVAGERTRDAILAYEEQTGLPAVGEPTPALYRRMTEETQAAAAPPSAAAPEADPPPPPAAVADAPADDPEGTLAGSTLVGSTWRFTDENGAAFAATFGRDGVLTGTGLGSDWTWRQDGDRVMLRYENSLGGSTVREGTLVSPTRIAGTAKSSRGMHWRWSAARIE